MIFEHEPAAAVRSKATGRLYSSVADLVTAEGAALLDGILLAAGIEATEEETLSLWAARKDLLALLIAARATTDEAMRQCADKATDAIRPAWCPGSDSGRLSRDGVVFCPACAARWPAGELNAIGTAALELWLVPTHRKREP